MSREAERTRTLSACQICGGPLPVQGGACPNCAATISTPADQATIPCATPTPRRVAGYTILRQLGAGGMGTVFEAWEEGMRRKVALKLIAGSLAPSESAVHRFALEAWVGGRLSHPNLVKVFERGTWEDVSYYSMELVEGGSLGDVIRNLKTHGRDESLGLVFGTREFVQWAITQVIAAARGLDYAHHEGVVHRDVKPMNLLLSREQGIVKVADFGLALDLEATRMTTAGKMMGTPVYMAPEQIRGQTEAIDARTDIYALGVTLFELLTLEWPYAGPTQELYVQAVLTSEARQARKINNRVSRDLETVIRKALEKDPRDRYQSAAAFADDLENVLNFRPIRAQAPWAVTRAAKWARRKPIHTLLIALLAVGLPIVGVLGQRAIQHQRLVREDTIKELDTRLGLFRHGRRHRDIVRTATEILQLDPRHVAALRNRGMSYMYLAKETADPAAAADLARKSDEDFLALIRTLPGEAWPHRLHAYALKELGRVDEARQAEDRAAAAARTGEPSEEDLYFDTLLALDAGRYEEAVRTSSQVILKSPGRADVLAHRSEAYAAQGELEKALSDMRVVLALDPESYFYNVLMGRLLMRSGAQEEGAEYFRRSLALAPASGRPYQVTSEIHFTLGRMAEVKGDRAAAQEHMEKVESEARAGLEADPDSPWCHVNLGAALVRQSRMREVPDTERIREAIAHYDQVLATLPGSKVEREAYKAALMNQCDALIETRDLARALRSCEEVTRLVPDDPTAFYNLAGVYALANRPDDALRALEKDVDLGDRDHEYLAADPWFESLRGHPRFQALLKRMRAATGS